MIILVKENGTIEYYLNHETLNENMLALYGDNSYIVETENIEFKLRNGVISGNKLPMIYNTDIHGALTNSNFQRFGVPVSIKIFADKNSQDNIKQTANQLRTVVKEHNTNSNQIINK